jgi:hypothetical protein
MPRDVIITPASGLIDFQGNTGISSASIQLDTFGNLNISNPYGDLSLGDTATDIYIGDGSTNVDIIFEQSGYIRGLSGTTVSIGTAGSFVDIDTVLRLKPYGGEGGELRFDFANGSAGYYIDVDSSSGLRFANYTTTGVYKFVLNSIERARLSNEGNFGINIINPTSRLHVVGDSLITGISTLRYIDSPVLTGITTASRISISTADSSVAQPEISFTGAAGTTITLKVLDDQYGTLSFSGSQGQLFTINNNLTSGTIFSVTDISGVPSIDVNADGTVALAPLNGSVGIGTTLASRFVDIAGDVRIRGALYAADNDPGANGQVLISTINGIDWATPATAIGGLVGINIQDEGVGVGTTVPTLNFTGSGIQATVVGTVATVNINATSANTSNAIVLRDGSGNFTAGTITANLSGNATSSNTSGYASVAGVSTNIAGPVNRIFYNSNTDVTTSSANLTYNGSTLTHSGTFNQNGTLNVYTINLPENPSGVGFGTTTANPSYYIGQTMGGSDYWKIYGESPNGTNTGTMVFEVQDDINNSETFAFRSRRTYTPPGFTTALLLDTSQAVFSGAITGTNLTLTNPTNALISGPASITIDPAAVGNETGVVRIRGDLIVDGTQTQVNSTTIDFADLNVGIATTVGTDLLLDGGGIGIGSTNIRKSIIWNNATSSLRSSESWDLASGKVYKIAGSNVLTNNTLGGGVVNSSLTSVGSLVSLTVTGTITAGANVEFSNTNTQRGIFGTTGTNDYWFVGGAASGASAGYLEIATGDDANEPIYVRQYTGSPLSGSPARTLTLLDAAGDTNFPGSLTIGGAFSLSSDLTVGGYLYRGNSIKTASLFVRGTGLNAAANRLVYLNGTAVVNTNDRGLTLTIIGVGLTHISSTNYDTFGDPAASNNLATAITNVNTGQIAVLTSYDAWETQVTNNLRAAALKVGLSKLANYGAGGSRKPYAAVFYGTSDDANAASHDVIERMESEDADSPRATIFCNLATEGSSIGIQGATSTNALYSANSAIEDPIVYVDSNNNTTVTGILTASSGINVGTNVVINSSGNIYFDGVPTVTNQNRGIYWTAYDKEAVGDLSDAAHIRHTVASGGLAGSVIEIRSDNDTTDGVNIIVASSTNGARINGNAIWHAGNDGAGTGLDADTVDGYQTAITNTASTLVVRDALGGVLAGVITCTDLNSTSDIRLKTSIRQIDNPLEKVLSIRGVNFEWRENHRQSAGVIAQEVEKVLPELVEGDKTKTVNYNGLIGVLVEAIKEQQKQIEELKKKVG